MASTRIAYDSDVDARRQLMTETRQQDPATQILRRLDRAVREFIRPAEVRGEALLEVQSRTVGGEPIPFAEATAGDTSPLNPGDSWGRAWDTVWMRVNGTVPGDWSTKRRERDGVTLQLTIDLGFSSAQSGFQAEGLVHTADGDIVRALSPLNHSVPLTLDAGESIAYWVEAAANPTLNNETGIGLIALSHLGDWDSAGNGEIYRFAGARLELRDLEVSALIHDIELLRGLAAAPEVGRRRRALVLAGLQDMLETIDPTAVAATAADARAVLAPLLSAPANASTMTLTAVGHAHIDSAWLWPLRETVRKCARTFSNVVALMEANPDFVFGCSSAQQFLWMKEHYPKLYARISERVRAGQFVPIGGMWVESDTNMPSGESLARQFVAGQGFFQQEFGIQCEEVWLPDSFGYTGAFPQIARLAGARWFFGQKLSWNRVNRMPHHSFLWEGIDGTRIFTHFTPIDTYNSDLSPTELIHAEENFEDHEDFSGGLVAYGYGDGGGGPTKEMLEAGRRSSNVEGLPRVEFGTPREFFETAEAEITSPSVWTGEMYLELHRGTYSSQARTKRGNRTAETLLRQAELWATTAAVRTSFEYPREELRRIWQRTLLLQFHDILPGSSISWVHKDAERMHAEDAVELRRIIEESLRALVGEGDKRFIANGSTFRRDGSEALSIDVGYRLPDDVTAEVVDQTITLVNSRIRLTISADGSFTDLTDLRSGRHLFTPEQPGNQFHLHQDIPTDWDAWDLDEHYRRVALTMPAADSVRLEQDGKTVVIERAFGKSRARQTVSLIPGRAEVDITTTVDWRERQQLLKLAFPFRLDARNSSAETQFGHVTRPTHENTSWEAARFEVVAHRWMHVSDGVVGAAVVNDSTYGHDVTRIPLQGMQAAGYATQIRQTLLRAPLYPDPESDQGEHQFRTRLVVTPNVLDAIDAAFDVDTPLIEITGGTAVKPLVSVDGDSLVIDTVKLAEDASGDVIVRCHEASGSPARASVQMEGFHITRVTLLEDDLTDLTQSTSTKPRRHDVLELELRGFELVTLRAARV